VAVVAYREERAQEAAEQGDGGSEQSRAVVQQAAPSSRNYRAVLDVLLGYAVRFGRVYPKLVTIAREAGVSVRTVQNAIDWLRRFGFVERVRRLVRDRSRLGGVRCRQTSNAYRVGLRPASAGSRSPFSNGSLMQPAAAHLQRATPAIHKRSPLSPMTTNPLGEGFGERGFQCEGALL